MDDYLCLFLTKCDYIILLYALSTKNTDKYLSS